MSVINIQGTTPVEDPEYRYKMPCIQGKVEGRGNGIKTAIPNMTQVALSLHRDPGEVTKFFGCELGAQTTWSPDTERAIVNGAHTTSDLQSKIFIYIEEFVLCPNCRLPETNYSVKNGAIYHKCGACGAKEMINMQHKLTTYILAQDKKNKKVGKKDKKDKKKSKEEEGDGEKKEKKEKKKKKDKKHKKEKKKSKEEEDHASTDSEGSVGEDPRAADEGAKDDDAGEVDDNNTSVDDLQEKELTAMESAIMKVRQYVQDQGNGPMGADLSAFLRDIQRDSLMPVASCSYIIIHVLLNEDLLKEVQIVRHSAAFKALINDCDNKHLMARHFIGALEEFFCKTHVELKKAFPLVLKQLYDQDVLEEEIILDWANAGVTHQFSPTSVSAPDLNELRASAERFIVWLREADEDDDDDDDE